MRRLARTFRCALAAASAFGLAAPAAAADPQVGADAPGFDAPAFDTPLPPGAIEATYEVYSGGFQALTLQMRFEGEGPDYAARFHARSDGFLGNLFTFRMDSEAAGTRTGDGTAPQRFRTVARWSDNEPRSVSLTYAEDGRIEAQVVPPPEEDERSVVPEEARAGTLDPISAVVHLMDATAQNGLCAGEARIFDGRRRIDVAAFTLGGTTIEETSYAVYAGPAQICRIELEPVTGFWEGEERRERYPGELRVFLAEVVEGRPPLPVRLEMDIVARGAVRAHLTHLHVGEQAAAR